MNGFSYSGPHAHETYNKWEGDFELRPENASYWPRCRNEQNRAVPCTDTQPMCCLYPNCYGYGEAYTLQV